MAELENTFSWSFSRHLTFQECPRKYWFNYYGAWGGWEHDAPAQARELYLLKKISNLHMLAGDVVHRAIAGVLNAFARGEKADPEETVAWCKAEMQRAFSESKQEMWRENPKGFTRLHEHHYGPKPDLPFLQKIGKKIGTCVRAFFKSRPFALIRETDPRNWLSVETLDTFDFEGTEVFAVPDFACPSGDDVVVFDWKTGWPSKTHRSQVILYGLYGVQKWGVARETLLAAPIYLLKGGDFSDRRITEEDEERVCGLIRDSIAKMRDRLQDPQGNVAVRESFHPYPGRVCRSCPFRSVCPEAL